MLYFCISVIFFNKYINYWIKLDVIGGAELGQLSFPSFHVLVEHLAWNGLTDE